MRIHVIRLLTTFFLTAALFGCTSSGTTEYGQAEIDDSQPEETATNDEADLTALTADGDDLPDFDDAQQRSDAEPPADTQSDDLADVLSDTDDDQQDLPQVEPGPPSIEEYIGRANEALAGRDMAAAIQVLEEARKDHPQDPNLAFNLLNLSLNVEREIDESDTKKAAASYLKTAKIAKDFFDLLGRVPPQLNSVRATVKFNEARALASAGEIESAVASLGQAFEDGYEEYAAIDGDPFFASIKDDQAFQAVVAENTEKLKQHFREVARKEIAETESFDFDFDLPNLQDNMVKKADFAGRILIVDIWGTWCPPCRMEIPHFVKLQDQFTDDLAIVGINYENGEGEEVKKMVGDFIADNGINYQCVIGDEATQEQIPEFGAFPTTLFLDREGNVRLKVVGYHPYEKLLEIVNELIGEKPPAAG